MDAIAQQSHLPPLLPNPHGASQLCPTVMTEPELIRFLRILEISGAKNYRHVTENLKRNHGLPRVHLCGKTIALRFLSV